MAAICVGMIVEAWLLTLMASVLGNIDPENAALVDRKTGYIL